MRNLSRYAGTVFIALTLAVVLFLAFGKIAYAGDEHRPPNRPPDRMSPPVTVEAGASSTSVADSASTSSATSESVSGAEATGGNATATGGNATQSQSLISISGAEGQVGATSADGTGDILSPSTEVTVEGDRVENNSTNVVLVPNNNTSGCMRVYGLSFGNGEGAGAFGAPFRDKACDFEQAADDAAAMGEHDIAWWWRCHKKNLYSTFKGKGETKEMAQLQCWNSMMELLVPTGHVVIEADEYDQLMAQSVQQEEFNEAVEQAEYRYAQQQNLLEELEDDHEEKERELERLKREAAALRKEQEQDESRRQRVLKQLEDTKRGSESDSQ